MVGMVRRAVRLLKTNGTRDFLTIASDFFRSYTTWTLYRIKSRIASQGKTIDINGRSATFDASSKSELDSIKWIQSHEAPLLQDLITELREDDVFWDVGAHIGVHSVFAAKSTPEGEVVAFEPYSPNRESLKQNAAVNGANVEVKGVALSNAEGETEFSNPEEAEVGNQWSAIVPDSVSETHVQTRSVVQTERGDDLVSRGDVPQPNVVKIDVEGASPLVIDGMESVLSADACRICYCEVHFPEDRHDNSRPSIRDFGYDEGDVREWFAELGFDVEVLEERERDVQLKLVKE